MLCLQFVNNVMVQEFLLIASVFICTTFGPPCMTEFHFLSSHQTWPWPKPWCPSARSCPAPERVNKLEGRTAFQIQLQRPAALQRHIRASKWLVIQIKAAPRNPSHLGWMSQLIPLTPPALIWEHSVVMYLSSCFYVAPIWHLSSFKCVLGLWELSWRNVYLHLVFSLVVFCFF